MPASVEDRMRQLGLEGPIAEPLTVEPGPEPKPKPKKKAPTKKKVTK